ncbi:MAG: ECF transporter S component [Oscillospiraceae bacterium]|nr:ECF transporter S component [Oscillospiraceae bacterium]
MSKLWNNAKDNLSFLLVCVAVFAVILILAKLFEKRFVAHKKKAQGARYIAYVAMFSAIAGALMLLEVPLFFAPSFYKMDLSELPVLLCSFYLGPVAGVTTEFLKVVIKLLLKGTSTAFVGDFANFVVGCVFVLPASAIYHAHKTKRNSIIGMVVGTLCMAVFGSIFNAVYLIPKFAQLFGMPIEVIVGMGNAVNPRIISVSTLALYAVVPFNLLKGVVDSVLTFLLYKRLEKVFFKERSK